MTVRSRSGKELKNEREVKEESKRSKRRAEKELKSMTMRSVKSTARTQLVTGCYKKQLCAVITPLQDFGWIFG